ncbi:hypothetical protein B0T16DRAFT_73420 [Cercophora newfieldiana]|uniref:Uncharacterized protein n=1 Tax=Cercophora newfieldiana TaxID=92897 RepID=A0AA40CTT5_9PEZI|nr:hypothetical protein B0T16DRAFT_73420 [Cercophora newfieldiana]
MYKTNNFAWKLVHVLSILAHLGLAAAGAVAYVYNASHEFRMVAPWGSLGRRSAAPCHGGISSQQMMFMAASDEASSMALVDVALHTLPMSCLAVGVLGLATNIGLFIILLRAERTKVTLTEGEQHWRKQIVTFFSCISNLLLAGAGIGLAGVLGTKLSESMSLIMPMVWAAIQVLLSIVTALFDAVKNHRDGRDLLD